MKTITLSARIWFLSTVVLASGGIIFLLFANPRMVALILPGIPSSLMASLPVLFIMIVFLPFIKSNIDSYDNKVYLVILICGVVAFLYGVLFFIIYSGLAGMMESWTTPLVEVGLAIFAILLCTSLITLFLSKKQLEIYFGYVKPTFLNYKQTNMETPNNAETISYQTPTSRSNKILIKGAITAALIGLMMLPTAYINDLVQERQSRNEAVVKEVDSRWASAQTISGPYIYLPYHIITNDISGKPAVTIKHLLIIPENKELSGKINHEIRERSIYKVLLYRATMKDQGNFIFSLPKELTTDQIQWNDARICFGISDFKGIEEKIIVRFKGVDNELSPGLPVEDIDEKGLSAPIALSETDLGKPLNYEMNIKIKGSEMLHFVPLSGNSHFSLVSDWPSPSFDGSNLPSERSVTKSGFNASWNFNKANLPFGTLWNNTKFDPSALSFGVTMIEPADQYAKTNRSIKYAFLIIGLTFSLFFIIELMQHKPIHPVQYVLIGLALVIFYSLLLAISEFMNFDYAYLIAAVGTILLIGLYAKAHFKSWKSSGIFTGVLSLLYGFIFVLIRLEDTALLVGSIGLFIILALTMYGSKKVNWYSNAETLLPVN